METTTIDNRTLVKEEKMGYASQYLVQHQTTIRDTDVLDRITQMSIEEVVS